MTKKIYKESNIRAIAEKIREKAKVSTSYTTAEMPAGIEAVYAQGKEDRVIKVTSLPTTGIDQEALYFCNEKYYQFITDHWVEYLSPNGAIDITESGTYDVKEYREANIDIATAYQVNDPSELPFSTPSNSLAETITPEHWESIDWYGELLLTKDNIWTDGEHIYYSDGPIQYVLDKSTNTWSNKTWSGITDIQRNYIWTDGNNIYYSSWSTYVLDKATSTWNPKTWNGLTNLYGESIWTDGDNIYYSRGSEQYILDKSTSTWTTKTWTGLTNLSSSYVWTDGDNIYYSNGSSQYILDKSTSTWTTKTWSGFTNLYGSSIWKDGDNVYYSSGSNSIQYVLDKATSTWTTKTWNGVTNLSGRYIWTDGDNTYYSSGSEQYVLDKATSTWTTTTWTSLIGYIGKCIWTDGNNIYYSYNASQYILDKATSTWNPKTWNGLTNLGGSCIWSDGNNIYYSTNSYNQYILDKSTSTWTTKTWNGLTDLYGEYIWTDGDNVYYSSSSRQYVLDKSTSTWTTKTWSGFTNLYGNSIWKDGDNVYYSRGYEQYVLDKSTSTWTTKTWSGLISFDGMNTWKDGENIYYSSGSNQRVLDKSTSTWTKKTWNGVTNFYGNQIWSDGNNIYYSNGSYGQYKLKPDTLTSLYIYKDDTWIMQADIDAPKAYIVDNLNELSGHASEGSIAMLEVPHKLFGTWLFNSTVSMPYTSYAFTFECNGATYDTLYAYGSLQYYDINTNTTLQAYENSSWINEAYRTIKITGGGHDEFLTWLSENAQQIEAGIAYDIYLYKDNKWVYIDNYSGGEIENGNIDTSDATATGEDILFGKTAYVGTGKVTGTIPNRATENLTVANATVMVPAGYYKYDTSKSVAAGSATTPATTITAVPTISVDANGKITASNSKTQSITPSVSAGYVSSGTAGDITVGGSNTFTLTTQAAKTITPSTSAQTAIESGVYATGKVTVAAIPSQYVNTSSATATAAEILAGETAYVNGTKITGTMTNRGAVSQTLSTATTAYTIPAGYHNGSGSVSITTETKSATPTTSAQTITPTSGKVLSSVSVAAIPSQYVNTSSATATAADIKQGKTAYANGTKITGTMKSYEDGVIDYAPLIIQSERTETSTGTNYNNKKAYEWSWFKNVTVGPITYNINDIISITAASNGIKGSLDVTNNNSALWATVYTQVRHSYVDFSGAAKTEILYNIVSVAPGETTAVSLMGGASNNVYGTVSARYVKWSRAEPQATSEISE